MISLETPSQSYIKPQNRSMQNYSLFHVLILWIILIAFFDRSRALKLHLNAWCIKIQVISKNPSTRGNLSAGIWLIKGKELRELSQHKINSESLHKKRQVIRMRFLRNWIRWCDLGQDMVEKKNLTTLQVKTLNQNDETIKRLEQVKRREFEWNFFSIQIGQVCVGDKETEITLKKVKT